MSGKPRIDMQIAALRAAYESGALTPGAVVEAVVAARSGGPEGVWIAPVPAESLRARAAALAARGPDGLALYGIPFAVKDNIDVAGMPTTAGCPEFSYLAERTAPVVERLLEAGAILVGKTNLDQFATGLVGVRSPFGVCANAFDPAYVSGGSSSGSAVATALGQVSFALGTDTAGSGRVPAAFNNLVGVKPTRGLLGARGVVPACRSLDCVSIFALTCADAGRVLDVAEGCDPDDAYSRPAGPSAAPRPWPAGGEGFVFGVPRPGQREFFGDAAYAALFDAALERLAALGGRAVEVDLAPFLEAAALLYEGPWVAERYQAIRAFIEERPEALLPVTRQVIGRAREFTAADAFAGQYRLAELRRVCARVWSEIDVLVTPTAGTIPTIAAVEAEPIRRNSELGHYTNFMNLLDLCATAVPSGFTATGLPFGITIAAPAFLDRPVLGLASRFHHAGAPTLGASGAGAPPAPDAFPVPEGGTIALAVCGAHLSGMPLNGDLTARGARLRGAVRTAAKYRFYALPGGPPARPGMVRVAEGDGTGGAIRVEVWEMPEAALGGFVATVRAPLAIGRVELETGEDVLGFLCEAHAVDGAGDITALGDWRTHLACEASAA